MSTETAHKNCDTCTWLGREAERTATALGRESWLSTTEDQGVARYARYESLGGSVQRARPCDK